MKIRWLWIFLALSMALNVAFVGGFIYARFLAPPPTIGPVGGGPGGRGVGAMPHSFAELANALSLDEPQKRRLRMVFQEIRRSSEPHLREQLMLRDRVVTELRKPQPDAASVERMLDQLALGRAAIQKDVFRMTSQFAATLTPEQQERFRQYVVARTLAQPGAAPRPRRDGVGPSLREDRAPRQQ